MCCCSTAKQQGKGGSTPVFAPPRGQGGRGGAPPVCTRCSRFGMTSSWTCCCADVERCARSCSSIACSKRRAGVSSGQLVAVLMLQVNL
jgi:hypothetical protein